HGRLDLGGGVLPGFSRVGHAEQLVGRGIRGTNAAAELAVFIDRDELEAALARAYGARAVGRGRIGRKERVMFGGRWVLRAFQPFRAQESVANVLLNAAIEQPDRKSSTELEHVRTATLAALLQTTREDRPQQWLADAEFVEGLRLAFQDGVQKRVVVVRREGQGARNHFVQDHAQRPNIAATVDVRLAARLLG